MIKKQEILKQAKEHNLTANTIEKDYVLNWVLDGIANSNTLKHKWVFKGGTCLKKCYFEKYRFSEDLDFTINDKTHINTKFLLNQFKEISEWIYEQSGIIIPNNNICFKEYMNPRNIISIQGIIPYYGPMARKNSIPTIKIDLTNDEIMVNKPDLKTIHHPYSDTKPMTILAYCIEEIFAEKLRALIERFRPRDLYDVIHLHMDDRWTPNKEVIKESLNIKCQFKKVPIPTIKLLKSNEKIQDIMSDWRNILSHQIAHLESFEYYWEKLPLVFDWLYK